MDLQRFFIIFITFFHLADSIDFAVSSFGSGTENILYRGSAIPSSGNIEFNYLNNVCLVGQAIFSERVPIWDSNSGKMSDFKTRFSLTIDTLNKPSPMYGDGFAFFIAPVDFQIPPNSAGSYLGLFNLSNYRESSLNQIIAVEFDSHSDENWDPPYEHVGINVNSLSSANYTAWNASFHSGEIVEVVITYNATTMMLVASWTYNYPIFPQNSSLSYQVNLKKVLPEWVTIGFSAATGSITESNVVYYWEFNSSLNRKWPSSQGILNEFGKGITVGIGASFGTAAILVVPYMIWRSTRKRAANDSRKIVPQFKEAVPEQFELMSNINEEDIESGVCLPIRYSYNDLFLATNGFSDQNKLGEGGFGGVYKGCLPNLDKEVAVKKISEHSTQGKNEYITELTTISMLKHQNLVQLYGWCHDENRFLLAYEIMPNGSLDSYLFHNKDPPLSWSNRFKIARGLASAVFYLHEDCGDKYVLHRDIKPSNVMLDSEFNAKLGDFGLARLRDRNALGSKTTKVAGTLGYFAPEYVSTRKASKATDMYSFGVTILETGSGRSVEDVDLVKWVWTSYSNNQLLSSIDKKLSGSGLYDEKEYECLMKVGLSCTHPDSSMRLTIKQAVEALQDVIAPEIPMNMPIVRYDTQMPIDFDASSSGTKESL